ncbi:trifolitoxin immunity domain-containing protein [Actinoplanes italicus]|uniref:Phosphotransferase family enzyme n=1 Tax=Actinoplanes italicus TaxID=113567 RepID=A0A2T0KH59_9ACTN|nr:aminoglycoside phosphotransferase family protein [Actinoplanes italicus]PRX22758.1 phosphotransferase family enzyme [Actinoplanes italicus]GIE28280.1 trifolitoxin immunity domain-containing protein [Actinoplanes italicus]
MHEQTLSGGNMGGAVRAGDTVRRPAGPWTPTIQRLLAHLRAHGVSEVPEPLGVDDAGRDVTSYLPGDVLDGDLPPWVWHDGILVAAARLLARLHAASAGFGTGGAVWRIPVHEPVEVICHNDFAAYNMVFTGHDLTGVIDWDTASPGPRVWDLAYLAYRLVPLTDPANAETIRSGRTERARRLRLLCDTYGGGPSPAQVVAVAVTRLHDLAAFTAARAADGHEHLHPHVALYRCDAAWISANTGRLTEDER